MPQKIVAAYTLGCKVNMYDTEAMLELFQDRGYAIGDFDHYADIYIINTCTVTNLGDKKSRQMIRRARKMNPDALVAAVGCYAQVAPDEVSAIEGVNLVLGTKDRKQIVELAEQWQARKSVQTHVFDIGRETEFEDLSVSHLGDRQRAFLKIQEGCDRYCAYCIITYARGRVRSRHPGAILEEVRRLAGNGYKEIVLAGIHVASYGKDLKTANLLDIIEAVHGVDGIERIRMSSIEPGFIDEDFIRRAAALPKLCDHFHLSLQSGCDRTLACMNRRYTVRQYREAVIRLREAFPRVALTTDVIVGFPGETDEDFDESCRFIEDIRLTQLHVFPYSPKKGTPAADFPDQIPADVKNRRCAHMLALGRRLNQSFLENFIGQDFQVLFEQKMGDNLYEGHSTNYIPIAVESPVDLVNQILPVRIEAIHADRAAGRIQLSYF